MSMVIDDEMVSRFTTNSPRLTSIFAYSLKKACEYAEIDPRILRESDTEVVFAGFDQMRLADELVSKMRPRLFRGERISLR